MRKDEKRPFDIKFVYKLIPHHKRPARLKNPDQTHPVPDSQSAIIISTYHHSTSFHSLLPFHHSS